MLSKIGFIGVGIMGQGMLRNLLAKLPAETQFYIWSRKWETCKQFSEEFGDRIVLCASAAEVVRNSNVTFSMLSDMAASCSVFDAPEVGIIAGVSDGKVIVDCATLSPQRMQEEEAAILARGGRYLEAPVSGSKGPAEAGQLVFLCGGPEDLFQSLAPALDAMGKARFLYGPVGQGSKVKLVINMVMGTMLNAFTEGLALANSLELPVDDLLKAIDLGAISNPMFKAKGAAIQSGQFTTNFPLKHAQKDLKLALDLAKEQGMQLPTTHAANDSYVKALSEGLGDEDFCAVAKVAH